MPKNTDTHPQRRILQNVVLLFFTHLIVTPATLQHLINCNVTRYYYYYYKILVLHQMILQPIETGQKLLTHSHRNNQSFPNSRQQRYNGKQHAAWVGVLTGSGVDRMRCWWLLPHQLLLLLGSQSHAARTSWYKQHNTRNITAQQQNNQ